MIFTAFRQNTENTQKIIAKRGKKKKNQTEQPFYMQMHLRAILFPSFSSGFERRKKIHTLR